MEIEKIKDIIKGRPVAILLHGSSVDELEQRIESFRNVDICWSALGNFPVFEKYILSKINKRLDFIFDCATVPESRYDIYEPVRQKRILDYLAREDNNMWVTAHGMIRDQFNNIIPDKTAIVDRIFPREEVGPYMNVPNSATLHIAAALYGGASAIYIFGLDGYVGDVELGYKFYYKPEETYKERMLALGRLEDPGINRDSMVFDDRIPGIIHKYKFLFRTTAPIYNVSPVTIYKSFEKISYMDAIQLLKGESTWM